MSFPEFQQNGSAKQFANGNTIINDPKNTIHQSLSKKMKRKHYHSHKKYRRLEIGNKNCIASGLYHILNTSLTTWMCPLYIPKNVQNKYIEKKCNFPTFLSHEIYIKKYHIFRNFILFCLSKFECDVFGIAMQCLIILSYRNKSLNA